MPTLYCNVQQGTPLVSDLTYYVSSLEWSEVSLQSNVRGQEKIIRKLIAEKRYLEWDKEKAISKGKGFKVAWDHVAIDLN